MVGQLRYRFLGLVLVAGIGSNLASSAVAWPQKSRQDESVAGNKQVEEIIKSFTPRGVQTDKSKPTKPEKALKLFNVRPGLKVDLVASEHLIKIFL